MAAVQHSMDTGDTNILSHQQGTDEQRNARLRQIQLEALGTSRRDYISTGDIDNGSRELLSLRDMERHRRVNQRGTRESTISNDVKEKLMGWNTAWTALKEDGILEQGLEDLNAGQSHRARLLSRHAQANLGPTEDQLAEARAFSRDVREANRSRGRGRGGRGGGVAGSQPSRHAQRRVPVAAAGGPKAKSSTVILPSVNGRRAASEPQKEYANLVRAQISTSASTAKTGRPPGANVENFKLVQPSQFMSHVRTVTKSAAPKVNVASSSIPTPATQSASAPKPGVVPKVTAQPVSKPNTADLLDAGTDRTIATTGSEHQTSYANDLLDISIDESNSLPPPMELSTKVNVEEIHPAVSKAVSREVASGAASMMAYLESKLAPELFKQVKLGLQKKGPLQPLNKQNQAAPPSLADAIQQRKQEWSQQVIGDTVTAKGSIFGEHVVRSRWAERQNSTASAASSTGLVKGINELHLDESQPSVASQSVGPAEVRPQHSIQYATTNPFGPKTTIGGPTLAGHTHARQNDNDEPAPSAAKPQVPDYIQTGYMPDDHGAAVRAEYQGNRSVPAGEFSKGTLSNTVKTFTVTSPQATSRARDYIVPSSQGPILWRDHATGGTKDDGQRLQGPRSADDHRLLRKESVSLGGMSTISPGLGEDMVRPGREGGIRTFNQPVPFAVQRSSVAPDPNSFVPPSRAPRTSAGPPRPPPFLGDAQPAKDPGAAARAQYSQASTQQAFTQPAFAGAQSTKSSTTGGPSRVSTRPRPPPYLDEAQPAKDPGAAARQHYGQDQHYGLREQAAPINTQFASPPKAPERALAQSAHKGNKITDYFGSPTMHSSSKTGEDSHMTRFKSGSNEPHFSKMDKSPPKPTSWIAELATAADPGAAARRQYGMKENSKP